jgi:hypothetical protein
MHATAPAQVEERKNAHINELMKQHEAAFAEIKNYYNDITANNLDLIKVRSGRGGCCDLGGQFVAALAVVWGCVWATAPNRNSTTCLPSKPTTVSKTPGAEGGRDRDEEEGGPEREADVSAAAPDALTRPLTRSRHSKPPPLSSPKVPSPALSPLPPPPNTQQQNQTQ